MFFSHLFFNLHANAKKLTREADGKCDRAAQAFIAAIEAATGPPDYSTFRHASKFGAEK
jgi:hypothetical protein